MKTLNRKTRNTVKHFIAALLCAAIMITGINLENTVTVTAATTTALKSGSTVKMTPGTTKRFTLRDSAGEDIVSKYKWSSSNTDVAKVAIDFIDQKKSYDECVEVTAVTPGTAVITGKAKSIGADITMTITVSFPKATAKQKKCKHSWKTTTAATCQSKGVKTCKKCGYMKAIAKVSHKYVNTTVYTTECEGHYHVFQCSGCECEGFCPYLTKHEECPTQCHFQAIVKFDKDGNVTPDSEYKSFNEALVAMSLHFYEVGGNHHSWSDWEEDYGVTQVTKTVKACKWCGQKK